MNYQTPDTCPCACCAEYACHCKNYPEAKRCDCFLCRCEQGLDRPMPLKERRELEKCKPVATEGNDAEYTWRKATFISGDWHECFADGHCVGYVFRNPRRENSWCVTLEGLYHTTRDSLDKAKAALIAAYEESNGALIDVPEDPKPIVRD